MTIGSPRVNENRANDRFQIIRSGPGASLSLIGVDVATPDAGPAAPPSRRSAPCLSESRSDAASAAFLAGVPEGFPPRRKSGAPKSEHLLSRLSTRSSLRGSRGPSAGSAGVGSDQTGGGSIYEGDVSVEDFWRQAGDEPIELVVDAVGERSSCVTRAADRRVILFPATMGMPNGGEHNAT